MKMLNFVCLIGFLLVAGAGQSSFSQENGQRPTVQEAAQTLKQFKATSPLLLDHTRLSLWDKIQVYSDDLDPSIFKEYLNSEEEDAVRMENTTPILQFYRAGFDKVLEEVKNTEVKKGSASIWLLYNMGFVVKTPSGCFGIDVDHRLAEQLEPYLDFLCITHNHGDHAHVKLMEAMRKQGKPVLSNFYQESPDYLSTVPTNYQIGNFKIRTDLGDHLANPKMPNFVTAYRIECGADAGNFSLLHAGDSGFNPEHFTNVDGPVDLVVLRWGAPRENNILGRGEGQVATEHAILSHLIELRHKPYPHGQASITKTLEHLPNVECKHTMLPFWGEKLTWKKGKLVR